MFLGAALRVILKICIYLLPKWPPPPPVLLPELLLLLPKLPLEPLELREGDDWRVDVEPNDRVDDEELEPWLPNERLLLLGMNVRLGLESGLEVKRLPNGRESFLGCDTVVRVLLWRGVPKERLPLVGCLSSLTCVPN